MWISIHSCYFPLFLFTFLPLPSPLLSSLFSPLILSSHSLFSPCLLHSPSLVSPNSSPTAFLSFLHFPSLLPFFSSLPFSTSLFFSSSFSPLPFPTSFFFSPYFPHPLPLLLLPPPYPFSLLSPSLPYIPPSFSHYLLHFSPLFSLLLSLYPISSYYILHFSPLFFPPLSPFSPLSQSKRTHTEKKRQLFNSKTRQNVLQAKRFSPNRTTQKHVFSRNSRYSVRV